jgi:hypothetical protein
MSAEIRTYVRKQMKWSRKTFGGGRRTEGICKHIEKELTEIRADPRDAKEWADIAILALDGLWRCYNDDDYDDEMLARIAADVLIMKQDINFGREWPPPGSEDEPNEHVRAMPPCNSRHGASKKLYKEHDFDEDGWCGWCGIRRNK